MQPLSSREVKGSYEDFCARPASPVACVLTGAAFPSDARALPIRVGRIRLWRTSAPVAGRDERSDPPAVAHHAGRYRQVGPPVYRAEARNIFGRAQGLLSGPNVERLGSGGVPAPV